MYVCREDLSNLPFTTMCIRESLRLHSPVQAVTRKYTQDMALPGDRTVPQGERNRFLGLFLTTYSTTFVAESFRGFPFPQQRTEMPDFCHSSQRCHLFGQHLWDPPQPCCLAKPPCKKRKKTNVNFLSTSDGFVMFDLSSRSSILCVLTLQTKKGWLLTPSSPFPQAPGTASSLQLHI